MGTPIAFTHPDCLMHQLPGHPERPERLEIALSAITEDPRTVAVSQAVGEPADLDDLETVHAPQYVDRVREAAIRAETEGGLQMLDPDTYFVPGSIRAALAAAGCATTAVDAVLSGRASHAVSIARPPGHHATHGSAMGFCIFNNVAAAAIRARDAGCARVAIVDFDVHHGNGTQDIFYGRDDVLFVSLHQRGIYPGTGAADERGSGKGEGFTLNIPMSAECGDREYLAAFDDHVLPALATFGADLVIISAGYDAHRLERDRVAGVKMRVSGRGFGAMTARIRSHVASHDDDRAVWILEGGYDPTGLAEGFTETLAALT